MPVVLRNNKRRSLYISHNVKDLTKEALRPRSWYIAGTNEVADPYTSVRKLFYDFNKTAFYGDGGGKDVNATQIINKTPSKQNSLDNKSKESSLKKAANGSRDQTLRNSFQKLELSENRSSTYITQDTNNNEPPAVAPLPISPPKIPPPKSTNFIQKLSSRNSDTISLKEESSSYADFYVPSSSAPKQSNFLRRSIKRRSFDFSKFKALDYVTHLNNDDDMASISSIGRYSVRSQPPVLLSPESRIEEVVDPKPMLERYLRDAEKDICSGIYPAANNSITLHDELEEEEYKKKNNLFIPWNKRASFIAATYIENRDALIHSPVKPFERRKSKRFASFRRPKSTITDISQQNTPSTTKKSFTLRRMNSLDRNTVKSVRGATSSLRRQNSENNTTWRKRRMSSTNSLSKQPSLDYSSINNRGSRQRKSNRYKVDGAQSFFDRYQDALRVDTFSVDLNKLTIKSNKSDNTSSTKSISPSMPLTPTSLDEKDNIFDYSEEALSKEFDYKLVGKTYQQLFYIRSRLSASARKTEFMCDGSFGCGNCELQCYPDWTQS